MGTAEWSSGSWRARWKGPEGTLPERPGKSGFSSERAARKYANDMEAAIRARRYFDPKVLETTVDQWWERWFPAQDHYRPNTVESYERNYRLYVKPRWGSTPMESVLPIEIQEFENELSKRAGHSIVNIVMAVLRNLFEDAALNRIITSTPFVVGRSRKKPKTEKRIATAKPKRDPILISLDQLDQICARLNPAEALMVTIVFWTGMRWSEVAAMRRSFLNVKPSAGVIPGAAYYLIDPAIGAVHEDVSSNRFLGPPKSGSPRRLTPRHKPGRVMDLPPFLTQLIEAYVENLPEDQDILFPNTKGEFRAYDYWNSKRWRPAVDGVPEHKTPSGQHRPEIEPIEWGLRLHDGKHFHATMMDDLGTHVTMRDYRLGHAALGARGVYSHPTLDMRVKLMDALEQRYQDHQSRRQDYGLAG